MGGDGGTLNHSRLDHMRLRRELSKGGRSSSAAAQRETRASVTLCAASRQPLRAPVVSDRLGQLFNKDALIACMLARTPAFAHVRSLRRDTSAPVALAGPDGTLQCALTREPVSSEEGHFSLGWTCGCVTADAAEYVVRAHAGAGDTDNSTKEYVECLACGKFGPRIRLGLTLEDRNKILDEIMAARKVQSKTGSNSSDKKRAATDTLENDTPAKSLRSGKRLATLDPSQASILEQEETQRNSVYDSLFIKSGDNEKSDVS